MRYALVPALAALVALVAFADESGELVFKKGPSTAELKAKNGEGENWEGPHVGEIKTFEDWAKVQAESNERPVFVFKHSTECPVNAKAAYRVNQWLDAEDEAAPTMYFVKVIETKPVSKKIEADLKIEHQSPQLLLIQNGKGMWSTSHEDITAEAIEKAIDEHVDETPEAK